MKTYHYYYCPLVKTYKGYPVCLFYISCWEQGSPIETPLHTYWKPVWLPTPHDVYSKDYNLDPYEQQIFTGMMLYRFFYNNVCPSEKTVIKVHDALTESYHAQDYGYSLEKSMSFLTRLPYFLEGHESLYAYADGKELKMTKRMRRHDGYRLIQFLSEGMFTFVMNIADDLQLYPKIFAMSNPDSPHSKLFVKYANNVSGNHLRRAKYSANDAEKRAVNYLKYNDPHTKPISFKTFMKEDLYF